MYSFVLLAGDRDKWPNMTWLFAVWRFLWPQPDLLLPFPGCWESMSVCVWGAKWFFSADENDSLNLWYAWEDLSPPSPFPHSLEGDATLKNISKAFSRFRWNSDFKELFCVCLCVEGFKRLNKKFNYAEISIQLCRKLNTMDLLIVSKY